MSNKIDTYQLIQDYLRGELAEADQVVFDELYAVDSTFKSLVDEEKQLSHAVKALVVEEIKIDVTNAFLKEKKDQSNKQKWKIGSGVTLVALVALLGVSYNSKEPQTINSNPLLGLKDSILEEVSSGDPPVSTPILTSKQVDTITSLISKEVEPIIPSSIDSNERVELQVLNDEFSSNEPLEKIQQPKSLTTSVTKSSNPCDDVTILFDVNKVEPCLFGTEMGVIEVIPYGGMAPYQVKLNGKAASDGYFDELSKGEFTIVSMDANECSSVIKTVNLQTKRCGTFEKAFNAGESWVYPSEDKFVELKILSRFGIEIITVEAENPVWDGLNSNGEIVKTDDYIFIISKEGVVIDKGNVTLVK